MSGPEGVETQLNKRVLVCVLYAQTTGTTIPIDHIPGPGTAMVLRASHPAQATGKEQIFQGFLWCLGAR